MKRLVKGDLQTLGQSPGELNELKIMRRQYPLKCSLNWDVNVSNPRLPYSWMIKNNAEHHDPGVQLAPSFRFAYG